MLFPFEQSCSPKLLSFLFYTGFAHVYCGTINDTQNKLRYGLFDVDQVYKVIWHVT